LILTPQLHQFRTLAGGQRAAGTTPVCSEIQLRRRMVPINRSKTALDYFLQAKRQFSDDPEVELYIGRTIPILSAHFEMAKN
jgi:hypothetical protein